MEELHSSLQEQKRLGEFLVEAGLITPNQFMTALNEQNVSGRQLREIFTLNGWIKQETVDVFMQNFVLLKQSSRDEKQLNRNQEIISSIETNYLAVNREDNLESTILELQNISVFLSPKKVLRYLLLIIASLCFISLIGQFAFYFLPDFILRDFFIDIFNVDKEVNIPSLYSASALLCCSVLLFRITYVKTVLGQANCQYWGALAIVFLYLSSDEFMSFHERLIEPVRKTLNTSGLFYFAWVIPGAIFVLTCLLVFLRFIISLPRKIKHLFLIAGTVYVSGTLGMEMVSGYYTDLYGSSNIIYNIFATIEEFLEMLGVAIFIYALFSYISSYMKGITINIKINHNS